MPSAGLLISSSSGKEHTRRGHAAEVVYLPRHYCRVATTVARLRRNGVLITVKVRSMPVRVP